MVLVFCHLDCNTSWRHSSQVIIFVSSVWMAVSVSRFGAFYAINLLRTFFVPLAFPSAPLVVICDLVFQSYLEILKRCGPDCLLFSYWDLNRYCQPHPPALIVFLLLGCIFGSAFHDVSVLVTGFSIANISMSFFFFFIKSQFPCWLLPCCQPFHPFWLIPLPSCQLSPLHCWLSPAWVRPLSSHWWFKPSVWKLLLACYLFPHLWAQWRS